jgi:diguanylate cyclase (GGDEF)-like protein
MARRRFMNEYMNEELSMLSNIGELSGFFTYGEFFHKDKSNQLLNETMTMLALREKGDLDAKNVSDIYFKRYNKGISSEHVISHFANKVSSELAELNRNLEKRVKKSADFIYKQAYFDQLTSLPNRLNLLQKISQSVGKMIVLVNIDDFTTINDFYGHEAGDKILIKLANILKTLTSEESAEVFKFPSDEFALIIDFSEARYIEQKLKHYIDFIKNEIFIAGDDCKVHVSVTIAAALITNEKRALIDVDMALKLAKKAAKEFIIFDEKLKLAKQYEVNINIAAIIRNAIKLGNIFPYFQPIVDVKTQKISKYEALVRLKKDEKVLSPFEFLEASQKIKLYPKITEIMIDKTFSYFKDTGIDFSINLSFDDMLNIDTKEYLFKKIKEYDIASQLTIEILETQKNDNVEFIDEFIDDVYSKGVSIAIDDFGSGFANFQHITQMRSDIMKIDGSLIKNIDKDKNARLIVETIIIFAKKLNKKTVAEYVHSKEVFDVVKELGIDYAQGYYFGKPKSETLV